MAQYKTFDPGVEVRGDVVLSLVNVMGAFKALALAILKGNGIDSPQPDRWYSQQAWLDSFKTISQEIGPNTLYQIGRQIPQDAVFPPEIDNLQKVFSRLDDAYRESHRGGEVGHYHYASLSASIGRLESQTPYPCDFDRGLIHALAEKFEPAGRFVEVRHEDNAPCKKLGADSCVYIISW